MSKLFCILTTTGPIMFSKVIDSYKDKDRIMVLKSEYLEPCVLDSCNITNNTIMAHHHDGTWYSVITRNVIVIFLDNAYVTISIIILICMLIYIYYKKN
jgi:mannosyltransferase OCH1-like enzyme